MWTWISTWPWPWLFAFLWAWACGLLFAVGVGHYCVKYSLNHLRMMMGGLRKPANALALEVSPGLTGFVERLFFAVLVGASVEGYPTAMMGWLALKLATNWNHKDMEGEAGARAFALTALLAGALSMLFAFWGGSIAHRLMPE
jgi:hypothetical protein